MSVIKIQLQKDYTIVNNAVLENPKLSLKAKGLWAYCMSRPQDWEFHLNHLATISKDKLSAVKSAIRELIAERLVYRYQKKDGTKFGNVDYVIYPYPQEEFKKCLPRVDFPLAGNHTLPITDSYEEEEFKKITPLPSAKEIEHAKRKLDRQLKKFPDSIPFPKKWMATAIINQRKVWEEEKKEAQQKEKEKLEKELLRQQEEERFYRLKAEESEAIRKKCVAVCEDFVNDRSKFRPSITSISHEREALMVLNEDASVDLIPYKYFEGWVKDLYVDKLCGVGVV